MFEIRFFFNIEVNYFVFKSSVDKRFIMNKNINDLMIFKFTRAVKTEKK